MNTIEIRKVTISDVEALQSISTQTFRETFQEVNTEEDMQIYLDSAFNYDKLKEEINNDHSAFYFATDTMNVLGYLKINFGQAQTEKKDNNAVEIERIYVLKAYQGKQVGQLLFKHALQVARERNAHYLWLGVWEENTKAINFYKKNGLVPFDKHIFRLGNDEQTDIMMKLALH
ncbi:GNAT family N-acetyltransferase [Asinibacterium sp. OR53]|uniref:GNAT family N-acetyltransferase n=1 Tax=Asinibacterium sp. OR53 TaxID=925409 RepID=UPI00047B3332|nr:GNAT family N-acetyltransferase [Asinibacterium sp. OR53]